MGIDDWKYEVGFKVISRNTLSDQKPGSNMHEIYTFPKETETFLRAGPSRRGVGVFARNKEKSRVSFEKGAKHSQYPGPREDGANQQEGPRLIPVLILENDTRLTIKVKKDRRN